MRASWLILRKDLRISVRNRTILILGFLAPLGLSLVLRTVFGGAGDDQSQVTFDVGVVDDDGGPVAAGFRDVLDELSRIGLVDLQELGSEEHARAAVDEEDLGAVWVVPEGFSDAVTRGRAAEVVVIADVDASNTAAFARAVADRFAAGVATSALTAQVALDVGLPPGRADELAAEVAGGRPLAVLHDVDADDARLDMATAITGGIVLFFVFFTAGLPMLSIIEERDGGTLARLLVAPVSAASVTAGKVALAVTLGVGSLVSLMVVTEVLMGVDWGPPLGALGLAVAGVAAAVGIMSIAGFMARTSEQAGNVQSVVAVVLGLVGGAFTPTTGASLGPLGTVRALTPHGQFLDGLRALQTEGAGAALPAIGWLALMAAVTLAVGVRLAHRAVRR